MGLEREERLRKVADRCEELREQLRRRWLDAADETVWLPKCEVVLHSSLPSYQNAVHETSAASSLIESEGRRVVLRRIDVLATDAGLPVNSLPHEITHVVLADRFADRDVPAWAGEGMALLAESELKQRLPLADFHSERIKGRLYRLADLFAWTTWPAANDRPLFYGQSLSITNFLVSRGTGDQFVRFFDSAMSSGIDAALREYYGINELETQWIASLRN